MLIKYLQVCITNLLSTKPIDIMTKQISSLVNERACLCSCNGKSIWLIINANPVLLLNN